MVVPGLSVIFSSKHLIFKTLFEVILLAGDQNCLGILYYEFCPAISDDGIPAFPF